MKRISYTVLIAILFIGMIGCGGDSTGPDPEEAPSLPSIMNQEAQPDVSYFENNQPKVADYNEMSADTSNYYAARTVVLSTSSLFGMQSFYRSFITVAQTQEPSFEDGKWVWTYTASVDQATGEWRLTAEEVSNGYKWALFLSVTDSDGNVVYDDYKVLEGTTTPDGSEGSWTFNTIDVETGKEAKVYTTSWLVTSDTEKEWSFKFFEEGSVSAQGDYNENKPEHTLNLNLSNEGDYEIFWNTDTMKGYIIQPDGEKLCWDDSFVNVSCS